jgi:UDP-N-acetylglucosamine 2-epimerase (non-hydrolysing)
MASRIPVVFVVHRPTELAMFRFGLERRLHPDIRRLRLVDYSLFVSLLRRAKAVFADGGSIQEECAILGKPCLILRERTERPDGLERNARLWRFDDSVAESFWTNLDDLAFEPSFPSESPSERIIANLVQLGFAR